MAKKYLLYIHDEGFGEEPNKSALINHLLNMWYGLDYDDDCGFCTEEKKREGIIPKDNIIATPEEAKKIVEEIIIKPRTREALGLCKIHATPLDSRDKCLQKGCKYA